MAKEHRIFWLALLLGQFALVNVAHPQRFPNAGPVIPPLSTPKMSTLDYERNFLLSLWQGEFDNREQLEFDAASDRRDRASAAHPRLHVAVRMANDSGLGNDALVISGYAGNDPRAARGARFYVLGVDTARKALQALAYKTGAGGKPLADPACDLRLQRDVDGFVGIASSDQCTSAARRLRIDERGLRWTEAGSEELVLERARLFACMIDFPKQPGKPMMYTDKYIVLHDQGGTFFFDHPDGRPMVLTLRNNWSFSMYRETLVVVIQERDESGPTLTYAWTEPGADRIGVNPSWMRVQCDLDTPANRQAQQELRADS